MTAELIARNGPQSRRNMRENGRINRTPPAVLVTPNRRLTHSLDLTKEQAMANPTRTCTIDGCDRPIHIKKRGWCNAHYLRWRRHGDPLKGGPQSYSTPEEAFAARTKWQGECLVWTGARCSKPHDYGQIWTGERLIYAHRYAWERVNGPIPDGYVIDHICHTPRCVRIEHLRTATISQNNMNRSGPTSHNVNSGVRNVHKNRNGWRAVVRTGDTEFISPNYSTIEEAAVVAEQKRREMFGEFAGHGYRIWPTEESDDE